MMRRRGMRWFKLLGCQGVIVVVVLMVLTGVALVCNQRSVKFYQIGLSVVLCVKMGASVVGDLAEYDISISTTPRSR